MLTLTREFIVLNRYDARILSYMLYASSEQCMLFSISSSTVNVWLNVLKFQTLSNKMLAIRAGIHKMLVRIANREDPDQTASSEAV